MDIKGKIHEIGQVVTVSDKFKKREIVLEYAENPTYPEYIKLEASQDKVNLFDSLKIGDHAELFFNLRGRPWTDKTGKTSYFNTLSVWRVNKLDSSGAEEAEYVPVFTGLGPEGTDQDLPF